MKQNRCTGIQIINSNTVLANDGVVAARNGRPAAGEIREAVPDNPGDLSSF